MLKEAFGRIERKLLRELRAHYGERLVSVVLFGSVGRGVPRPDSDIDLLIVARDLPAGRMKRMKELQPVEDALEPLLTLLRKKGIETYLSPLVKSPQEAAKGSPLFLDMVEDGRILFDRRNFFKNVLARLKARLDVLGAKRVWRGDAWYWDLKPDFKPGEVFEL